MTKTTAMPWQHPQPKPVGYEERPRRSSASRGKSFRLVLEPVDGPQYSVVAVIAFLIALGVFVAAAAIKVSSLLLAMTGSASIDPFQGLVTNAILAGLALAAIVLGHIGLHQVQTGVRRGLVMSGFTLGVGYALLVLEALELLAAL